jgi:hypothetical protein
MEMVGDSSMFWQIPALHCQGWAVKSLCWMPHKNLIYQDFLDEASTSDGNYA